MPTQCGYCVMPFDSTRFDSIRVFTFLPLCDDHWEVGALRHYVRLNSVRIARLIPLITDSRSASDLGLFRLLFWRFYPRRPPNTAKCNCQMKITPTTGPVLCRVVVVAAVASRHMVNIRIQIRSAQLLSAAQWDRSMFRYYYCFYKLEECKTNFKLIHNLKIIYLVIYIN